MRMQRGGVRWLALAKMPPHHPARPRPAAVGIAKARPRLSAPRIQAGPRGHAANREKFVTVCDKLAPIFPNFTKLSIFNAKPAELVFMRV